MKKYCAGMNCKKIETNKHHVSL